PARTGTPRAAPGIRWSAQHPLELRPAEARVMAIAGNASRLPLPREHQDAPDLAPPQLRGRGQARRSAADDDHVEVGAAQASASRNAAAGRPVPRATSDTKPPRQEKPCQRPS